MCLDYSFIHLYLQHIPKSGVSVRQQLERKEKKGEEKIGKEEKENMRSFMSFRSVPHHHEKRWAEGLKDLFQVWLDIRMNRNINYSHQTFNNYMP